MHRISGQKEKCFKRAAVARQLATSRRHAAAISHDYSEIAMLWLELAKTFELAEEVSGFIQWQSQRVDNPT